MERAARKAAPRLRRDFGEVEHLQVSRKGPADFVSMADQRAERTLFDELKKARPDWGFLLEEAGEIEGDPAKPRWVIDPLDGTSNFRSEEHTSELQSLMRISYAVFCLKKKKLKRNRNRIQDASK